MGRAVIQELKDHTSLKLTGALEHSDSPLLGQDAGVVAGVGELSVLIGSDFDAAIRGAEVVIDFSSPSATVTAAEACESHGAGLVVGTTGLDEVQTDRLRSAAERIPLLISPNMSVGVNVTFKLLEIAAEALAADSDVEIYEIHHRHKADAPSGTAVRMGEIVASTQGKNLIETATYGREGQTGEREVGKIGFHSARGGDVVGEHSVTFALTGERVEITHRAGSRANFAAGAVRAAAFIANKKAEKATGLFNMNEVLGLS